MERKILEELLVDACRAPSGDNVQPWRFQYDGTTLSVFNVPGIHNPHLDFEERGAYVAHGALLENLSVAAPHYGYEAAIVVFPNANEPDLVAQVTFTSCPPYEHPLFAAITKRATNRHPYEPRPITKEGMRTLEGIVSTEEVEIKLTSDKVRIASLAKRVSDFEAVLLGNPEMSQMFFSHIVWSVEEELQKRAGFLVKTMELHPVQERLFRLASVTWGMAVLRRLGLPKLVARDDAKLYASASIMGAVAPRTHDHKGFIVAGRALERMWLSATKEGLAFQPFFGTTMLHYKHKNDAAPFLRTSDVARITEAGTEIQRIFEFETSAPAILFRVGYAKAPSAYTSRKPPEIVYS